MNNRIQLAIFDLDGTLLDTLADLADAMNLALSTCGYPVHPVEAYRFFVGNGVERLVSRSAPAALPPAGLAVLLDAFKADYTRHVCGLTAPYPGVMELLHQLREGGVRMAVCTNKPQGMTDLLIRQYFNPDWFACVVGASDRFPVKPDPSGVRHILERAGIRDPARAVMIGDSAVDIQTARNAGIKSIGVLWGFRPASELQEAGADWLAEHPSRIFDILMA